MPACGVTDFGAWNWLVTLPGLAEPPRSPSAPVAEPGPASGPEPPPAEPTGVGMDTGPRPPPPKPVKVPRPPKPERPDCGDVPPGRWPPGFVTTGLAAPPP